MQTTNVEQLLDELAKSKPPGSEVAATSLNVVAFVEHDARLLGLLLERIDALSKKYAARSVVLCGDEDGEPSVREQCVRLAAARMNPAQMRSLTHDLFVPNVRSVLLWAGEHLTDERFGQLADLADTVVLFSSVRDAGLEPLRELLALSGNVPQKIRDLSYLRLFVWQDLIAQFFDDPHLAAELQSIARVEVAAGSSPEAYYLVGWLASRLRWDACGAHEFCNAEGATIAVDVQISGPARRISRVNLHSGHCTFGAAVDPDSDEVVCLTVEGEKSRPQRCLPLHDVDMLSLIERAIFERPANEIYAETLAMVGRLLEHGA